MEEPIGFKNKRRINVKKTRENRNNNGNKIRIPKKVDIDEHSILVKRRKKLTKKLVSDLVKVIDEMYLLDEIDKKRISKRFEEYSSLDEEDDKKLLDVLKEKKKVKNIRKKSSQSITKKQKDEKSKNDSDEVEIKISKNGTAEEMKISNSEKLHRFESDSALSLQDSVQESVKYDLKKGVKMNSIISSRTDLDLLHLSDKTGKFEFMMIYSNLAQKLIKIITGSILETVKTSPPDVVKSSDPFNSYPKVEVRLTRLADSTVTFFCKKDMNENHDFDQVINEAEKEKVNLQLFYRICKI